MRKRREKVTRYQILVCYNDSNNETNFESLSHYFETFLFIDILTNYKRKLVLRKFLVILKNSQNNVKLSQNNEFQLFGDKFSQRDDLQDCL